MAGSRIRKEKVADSKISGSVWTGPLPGGGGLLPYKRLMGMCRWMGSHFHDWTDYKGVAFSIELLEWGRTFSDFWGRELFIFTVSKRTRIFVR